MALTITEIHRSVFGNKRVITADLDFDSSYPTGGEGLTPADVALNGFDLVLTSAMSTSNTGTVNTAADLGHSPTFDYTNNKILMTYSDLNGSADGPSIEVADTTNLTGVRVRALIIGY